MTIGRWAFRPGFWPTAATVCLLPALLSLALWQYGRAEIKQEQQESFSQQDSRKAQVLQRDLADSTAPEFYRRVFVRGRFADRHLLLDNRTYRGRAGYEVYSLFLAEEDAICILVNRGWVPADANRQTLPATAISGLPTVIRGLLAAPPRPGLLLGDTGYREFLWPTVVQWLDVASLAELTDLPLFPMVLLLDKDNPGGFVREWRAYSGISPERHRGYALQWFSLALAVAVIYVVVNLKRTTKSGAKSDD